MLAIPCNPALTHYEMQVVLDAVTYAFEFRWNTREEAWYMHIRTQDGTDLLCGVKVVVRFLLAGRPNDPRMPPGRFFAEDTSGNHRNPGIADLGDRVQLYYLTNDEY